MKTCTIRFIGGNLEGIEINTSIHADVAIVGKRIMKPCGGGSPYQVIAVLY